jgi:hypothetical protein
MGKSADMYRQVADSNRKTMLRILGSPKRFAAGFAGSGVVRHEPLN